MSSSPAPRIRPENCPLISDTSRLARCRRLSQRSWPDGSDRAFKHLDRSHLKSHANQPVAILLLSLLDTDQSVRFERFLAGASLAAPPIFRRGRVRESV